jgi:SNF2 family DNA or RNA helicase
MKDAMVLSWEQGLGKTRGSLAWAKLKGARKVLIICPQDLKHQWIAQAATFDIALTEIAGYGDIEKIKNAESGYYIVHYELLKGGRRLDTYVSEYLLNTTDEEGDEHTFNALCPKCKGMREDGWNGRSCKKCGYHVWTRRVKALYTYMKKMFDTVIVDEGVKIKSKHSLQGISVRSLHAKNRLLLSGSPIKGWITDAFWLLHWTLGNASPRFPYHYIGGTEKFLEDFGVFEYVAEEFRKSLSKGKKKLLPEIGNLHLLWKMFAPSIIRRVKAETGEDLAKKTVHRIKVNFTVKQKETYDWWIANFNDWFKASHNTDMEEDNIAMKQMILGLLWKLRFSATVPASPLLPGKPAPGKEETFYPGARSNSNYTEKALFVIGKVKECIAAGEQVVIFSALQDEMNFLKALLERHHFRAEVANATVNPKKRGLLMNDFKARKFDVLVAGIQSVNFGHDLVNASTVIMTDYEWDHSTTRQAIDRVHRLTSTREVNVYMLYTDNAIDWKQLFEVIDRKGQSSDLALDGKLMDQEEAQVDFFKIARELLQSHKMGTGGLLSEEDIEHKISELFMHNLAQSVGVDEGEVAPRPLRLSIGSKPRRGVYVNQIELSL